MPKRAVSEIEDDGYSWLTGLPNWRATGLSLAVVGSAAFNGVGALGAAAIAAVVIYALVRLHRHAPQSPSTGDLVGSTLGPAAARFTSLIQLAAYVILGAGAAIALGLQPLAYSEDIVATLSGWWWPAWSVAITIIAAAVVAMLPTRTLGAVTAVLAAAGLLVFVYLALAIVARVAAGTDPVPFGSTGSASTLLVVTAVIPLGLGLVGFEAATAASGRLRSVGRPLGAAVGVAALCAATVLLATNVGSTGGFHYDATNFSLIIMEFFGTSGRYWLIAGTVSLGSAAVLALMWAATRTAGRVFGVGLATSILTAALTGALAVVLCRFHDTGGGTLLTAAALLLLLLYVVIAEANSRLQGSQAATQTPRVLMVVVLGAVVLIPLRANDFVIEALWPVAVTAVIVGVAALLGGVGRSGQPVPQPR